MRQIIYYCDLCKERIPNPKAEESCFALDLFCAKNWEEPLHKARAMHGKNICKKCADKIDQFIKTLNISKPEDSVQ